MEQEKIRKYAMMIVHLVGQMTKLPDDRQSLGYGKGQRVILFYLERNPNGVPSGELSQRFHVGTGRIGNALKELEKKGYVYRKNDEKDKRKVLVYPTKKGLLFSQEQRQGFYRTIENAIDAVGEERFAEFLKTYQEIMEAQNAAFGKDRQCSNSMHD